MTLLSRQHIRRCRRRHHQRHQRRGCLYHHRNYDRHRHRYFRFRYSYYYAGQLQVITSIYHNSDLDIGSPLSIIYM